MPASGYGVVADAPPLLPSPSGLLAQFPPSTVGDEHWLGGVKFSPENGTAVETSELCEASYTFSTDATRPTAREFHPFAVILRDRCSTFGWTEADYVGRASRALAVRRHWAVEREFEHGAQIPANPHLAQTFTMGAGVPTSTILLASGAKIAALHALGLLDEAIGNAAIGRGVIHATLYIVALWKHLGLLNTETMEGDEGVGTRARILSPAGNTIIAGAGYQGRDPSGNVPASHASQWAYATDWLKVEATAPRTTPGTLAEATAKERNDVIYRQDQFFAVRWSGLLHAAVQVDTATPTIA